MGKNLTAELSSDKKEIEIYIDGWFLCGVEIENCSKEALEAIEMDGIK